jgi:hypothetical protein
MQGVKPLNERATATLLTTSIKNINKGVKMNELTRREIEEIHEYLFNKDGMRLGQRIKTNFSSIENKIDAYQLNMLNRLSDIQDKLDEPTITVGGIILYTLILSGVLGIVYAWINFT